MIMKRARCTNSKINFFVLFWRLCFLTTFASQNKEEDAKILIMIAYLLFFIVIGFKGHVFQTPSSNFYHPWRKTKKAVTEGETHTTCITDKKNQGNNKKQVLFSSCPLFCQIHMNNSIALFDASWFPVSHSRSHLFCLSCSLFSLFSLSLYSFRVISYRSEWQAWMFVMSAFCLCMQSK